MKKTHTKRNFWNWIKQFSSLWRFLLMILIIAGCWYGFIRITGNPPYDPTHSLIMVWVSAALLILAGFPNILRQVKRIKVKDFEIELFESIDKSITTELLSIQEGSESIYGRKGDLRTLLGLVQQARQNPGKPVLLTVNLDPDYFHEIIISKLYLYLLAFEEINHPVIVLFTEIRREQIKITQLNMTEIIGTISGKRLKDALRGSEPSLAEVDNQMGPQDMPLVYRITKIWKNLDEIMNVGNNGEPNIFNRYILKNMLGNDLKTSFLQIDQLTESKGTLIKSLRNDDEYIILLKDDEVSSILMLDKFAREFTSKALSDFEIRH